MSNPTLCKSALAVVAALSLPALVSGACDLQGSTTSPGGIASAAGACPDVSSVSAVASIDFAKEFGIDVSVGGKIKAGVTSALELKGFAAKLDGELKVACGNLATDLGAAGPWDNGEAACKAAAKAMADIKGKIGGGAKFSIDIKPPRCSFAMDAMANCLAECDANLDPGSAKVKCEKGKLAGRCDAQCTGTCEVNVAAKCEGTCQGSCDANFSGSCGGNCTGKCDGKKVDGAACAGTCSGTCSANADGKCGGNCTGDCKLDAAATCEGTCHGECSVEMQAPKCEGEVTPPSASAECNAQCETKLSAELECTPASVAVNISGGVDAKAVAQYKAALEKNLPAVLKVSIGMKDEALAAAANVKAVIEGVQVAIKQVKGSPSVGARPAACVTAPFAAAVDAAASIQANVSVSVDVQASASASASGSASGKAG